MGTILTPTNVDFVTSFLRNPITNTIQFPVMTFNTGFINPFYADIEPLNKDPKYRKRMKNYFYTKLTEKWLYKDQQFRKLLKYFKINKKDEKTTVELIKDLKDVNKESVDKKDRKYIFRYIEKIFISKQFVEKVLRQYIKRSNVNWYDLVRNTRIIKELFAHKLKKLIVNTIDD